MYTIAIIKDKCIGCGYCVELASDIYTINEDNGKAYFFNHEYFISLQFTDDEYSFHDMVREQCPVNAIKISKNK